ncbi:PqqD family peptide modification chaperone [Azospirillum sp. SYSU D00513]|uniref:PqqD family peptide modification chaperone n=1 Tax=Azospirillum sp. SYSU D00513 TaxID=2812561 RepID=UPI001A959E48|nr:PqqD family peptide modification chaperone [Azospirillum sp. SYSU D00513]
MLTTRLVRNPDFVATDVDGDIVMMSMERGEYYGIGGVGIRVWELLGQPTSLAEVVQTICSEYAVDEATCEKDMRSLIGEMIRNGVVTVG